MRVTNGDGLFFVMWKFSNPVEKPKFSRVPLDPTHPIKCTCSIFRRNVNDETVLVSTATVTKYEYDPYDRAKARKYALQQALEKIYVSTPKPTQRVIEAEGISPEDVAHVEELKAYTKSLREPFWEAFKKQKPDEVEQLTSALKKHITKYKKVFERHPEIFAALLPVKEEPTQEEESIPDQLSRTAF